MRYILGFMLALVWHSAVHSQGAIPCASLRQMIDTITGPRYREAPLFEATAGGQPVKAYANAGSGTWTLLFEVHGMWCIGAAGSGFKPAPRPVIGKPT